MGTGSDEGGKKGEEGRGMEGPYRAVVEERFKLKKWRPRA